MQVSTNSSLLWYKLSSALKEPHMKAFEAQPTVARDIDTFEEKIGEIKSVDDLMKNRTVLTMVLSAFQLESEIDKPAMVRKILTENPADKESLVNRLAEPRWAKLAGAMYGLNSDPDFFQKQSNVDAILAGYKTNEFEKFEGQNADGVREAMYFKRLAGNYEQQRDRLEKQIDIADFKDPEKIDKMIQRFLVYTEINNTDPASNPMLSLFQPISNGEFVGPQPIQIDLFV
mgnify:CR=1 FL=1